MPAIPAINAVVGIAGAASAISSAKDANNQSSRMNSAQIEQMRLQNQLEADKFGWTKEQTEAELARKLESANKFWSEYGNSEAPTWEQSLEQSQTQLNPLYDKQMTDTLTAVDNANKRRGFYGQLPGDQLLQKRAAEVTGQKNMAVGQLANQLFQQGQQMDFAKKQLGINSFGIYDTAPAPPVLNKPIAGQGDTNDVLAQLTKYLESRKEGVS